MGEMRKGGVIIYKLLAVDIDGTLITTDMKLTGVTRRAIARTGAGSAGHLGHRP